MSSFGDRLREARNAIGMSQERLGTEVGVTKGAISGWENGRDFPSFPVLLRLRVALRQSLDYLMAGAPQETLLAVSPKYQVRDVQAEYAVSTVRKNDLSAREFALVQRFRVMTPRQQQGLLDLMRMEGGLHE